MDISNGENVNAREKRELHRLNKKLAKLQQKLQNRPDSSDQTNQQPLKFCPKKSLEFMRRTYDDIEDEKNDIHEQLQGFIEPLNDKISKLDADDEFIPRIRKAMEVMAKPVGTVSYKAIYNCGLDLDEFLSYFNHVKTEESEKKPVAKKISVFKFVTLPPNLICKSQDESINRKRHQTFAQYYVPLKKIKAVISKNAPIVPYIDKLMEIIIKLDTKHELNVYAIAIQRVIKLHEFVTIPVTHKVYEIIRDAFNNQQHIDVLLKVQMFKRGAHRVLLSAESKVFQEILKDPKIRELHINDIEGVAMNDLLNFIYKGVLVQSRERVLKLLHLADKLCMDRLKMACERYLYQTFEYSNCFETLLHAYVNKTKMLKILVTEQMGGFNNVVMQLPDWEKFRKEHPKLAQIIENFEKLEI